MKSEGQILQSLEIAGFKSFGKRKKLDFSNGITAIVGPNGSGKSNVADALRWVLGEQRTSRMRSGKSEELIFHGTESKAMASVAEVTLVLNNANNLFALPASQIEISRQLYRSGESSYRLNGRKVNFARVEELLASAGIGKNSYAVVGQGTIDQLLTMDGKDRKMLFDEASGIRQYEIRRIAAKRKLEQSSTDLEKVTAIVEELLPSLSVLQKQAEVVKKQTILADTLKQLKTNYVLYWQDNYQKERVTLQSSMQKDILLLEKIENNLSRARQDSQQPDNTKKMQQIKHYQAKIKSAEKEKSSLVTALIQLEAEIASLQTNIDSISTTSAAAIKGKVNHETEQQAKIQKSLALHTQKVAEYDNLIKDINTQLKTISNTLNETRKQLEKSQKREFFHHASGLITTARTQLRNATARREIDITMQRLADMIQIALTDDATELALTINKLQQKISTSMAEREEVVEAQTKEIIKIRSLELDYSTSKERLKNLQTELDTLLSNDQLKKESIAKLKTMITDQSAYRRKIIVFEKDISVLQNKLLTQQQNLHQKASNDMFAQFEKLVSEQKTLELHIANNKEQLEYINSRETELSNYRKEWFGTKKITGEIPVQPVRLEEITKIESELNVIDDIDAGALEQANELSQRVNFLQTQKKDLQKAIADSEQFIHKIEAQTKQKFIKNFEKINAQFQKYFVILFGGGTAKLSLVTKEEFAIDIITTPPGKRTHSIAALSGGEKSLASLALLAAILTSNPTPFIFLDEVDAALDDKNSTRFNTILKDLARHSQIIVITHNHETMQAAKQLFGITTSQKGDSEVLSLQLQQADSLTQEAQAAKPVDKAPSLK